MLIRVFNAAVLERMRCKAGGKQWSFHCVRVEDPVYQVL